MGSFLLVSLFFLNHGHCKADHWLGATVFETNMATSMQDEAILVSDEAMVKFESWKNRKSHIEQHFDSVYGRKWICQIGNSGGFSVDLPETEAYFITFKLRNFETILYRSVDRVAAEELIESEKRIALLESNYSKLMEDSYKKIAKLTEDNAAIIKKANQLDSSLAEANAKTGKCETSALSLANQLIETLHEKQSVVKQLSDSTEKLVELASQLGQLLGHIARLTEEKAAISQRVGRLDTSLAEAVAKCGDCETQLAVKSQSASFVDQLQAEKTDLATKLSLAEDKLSEYTDKDKIKERRAAEQSLVEHKSYGDYMNEAAMVAKEALATKSDLQLLAVHIWRHFNSKYAPSRFFCFIVDRSAEFGFLWPSGFSEYTLFSVQGITVALMRVDE